MSTERIEKVLAAKPKPGEVGGPMVGYAEAERIANPEPGPAMAVDGLDETVRQLEKASGKPISELTQDEFDRIPIKLSLQNKYANTDMHVVLKDPSMHCRWFNRTHKDGTRVTQAYSLGFTACTRADVQVCSAKSSDDNGALITGDLVLLKIPKIVWWSFDKGNRETAKARVNQAYQSPSAALRPGESHESLPNGADYFIPDIASAQKVDATEARRLVYS